MIVAVSNIEKKELNNREKEIGKSVDEEKILKSIFTKEIKKLFINAKVCVK